MCVYVRVCKHLCVYMRVCAHACACDVRVSMYARARVRVYRDFLFLLTVTGPNGAMGS